MKPDLLGPQRGPATPARLLAQWRATEAENREAVEIRRQWMRFIGCDEEEISKHCDNAVDLDLQEELDNLVAAMTMK